MEDYQALPSYWPEDELAAVLNNTVCHQKVMAGKADEQNGQVAPVPAHQHPQEHRLPLGSWGQGRQEAGSSGRVWQCHTSICSHMLITMHVPYLSIQPRV